MESYGISKGQKSTNSPVLFWIFVRTPEIFTIDSTLHVAIHLSWPSSCQVRTAQWRGVQVWAQSLLEPGGF